jgi:exodeoxyribonuclease-3
MRLATWNVNSVTARLDFVLDYLAARQPDVLCVQELKIDDQAFPRLAFAQAGYAAATHGQPQWNGVAVLVRSDAGPAPEIVQAGLPGQEAAGARLITVRALGVTVTSVYVPNGKSTGHPDFQMKLRWLDALIDHVQRTHDPSTASVIGGDFNLCPGELDSWDPKGHEGYIFHTAAERERYARLLALGYHDLFREKYPTEIAHTWWDYRAGAFHKKQGLRIDLLLGSKPVMDRVTTVAVDRDFRKKREARIPSDHAPVVAELDL